jgi:lipopolysaccharide cholinephosphotransferase
VAMIEIKKSEVKQIQIEILKEFAGYCEKNNLVYFLGYGTLLGAVRHKAFIPWDDDIDVVMPRSDYDKFIRKFNKKSKKLEVFDILNEPTYHFSFAKLSDKSTFSKGGCDIVSNKLGVHIDIFPLDGVSSNKKEQKRKVKEIKIYRNILDLKNISIVKNRALYKNIMLLLGKVFFYFIDYKKIVKKIVYLAKELDYDASNTVACLVWNYGAKEIMSKEIFSKSTKLEFENYLYDAPQYYDRYLKNIYGDYMILPPEEKRISHHALKAYRYK